MDMEPAEWPIMDMRLGSPPKEWMLSRSHSIASLWSRRPGFLTMMAGEFGNPKIFRR